MTPGLRAQDRRREAHQPGGVQSDDWRHPRDEGKCEGLGDHREAHGDPREHLRDERGTRGWRVRRKGNLTRDGAFPRTTTRAPRDSGCRPPATKS